MCSNVNLTFVLLLPQLLQAKRNHLYHLAGNITENITKTAFLDKLS